MCLCECERVLNKIDKKKLEVGTAERQESFLAEVKLFENLLFSAKIIKYSVNY